MITVAEVSALLNLNVPAIVKDKEAVKVTPTSGTGSQTVFFVEVADLDRGKIIGKQGRTARSVRIILGAIAKANQHHHALSFDDPLPHVSKAKATESSKLPHTGWATA